MIIILIRTCQPADRKIVERLDGQKDFAAQFSRRPSRWSSRGPEVSLGGWNQTRTWRVIIIMKSRKFLCTYIVRAEEMERKMNLNCFEPLGWQTAVGTQLELLPPQLPQWSLCKEQLINPNFKCDQDCDRTCSFDLERGQIVGSSWWGRNERRSPAVLQWEPAMTKGSRIWWFTTQWWSLEVEKGRLKCYTAVLRAPAKASKSVCQRQALTWTARSSWRGRLAWWWPSWKPPSPMLCCLLTFPDARISSSLLSLHNLHHHHSHSNHGYIYHCHHFHHDCLPRWLRL